MEGVRFPGESEAYRRARNELLQAELELRRKVEDVAALRRKLPLGGEVQQDYEFEEGSADLADTKTVRKVRLSELFEPGQDTLVLYSYMYGPKMKEPCPMCTSFLDGLDGNLPHIRRQVSFALAARSPLARIRELARGRGWRHHRLLSAEKNSFARDYFGESVEEKQNPMLNVFVKRGGKVHHFWGTESLYAKTGDDMDSRHIDQMWPLWHVLDLTPQGRGGRWYPAIDYAK